MNQLITDEYKAQNEALHSTSTKYGTSGAGYRELVRPMALWGRKHILDYGCGKCTLAHALGPGYIVYNYDPCVPEHADTPEPCEVVVCTDVLEHIEPDLLQNVLADLRRVVIGEGFFAIALQPSSATLDDGRNAHLSLHSPEEWRAMLEKAGFEIFEEKPKERTVALYWCKVR